MDHTGIHKIDHKPHEWICEQCGDIFTTKGTYWEHIKEFWWNNDTFDFPTCCKEDINQENIDSILSDVGYIFSYYFHNRMDLLHPKKTETLLGVITLNAREELDRKINTVNITVDKNDIPRPLLKWVGGKGQIMDTLIKSFPKTFEDYYELFVGGGSVLLGMLWAKNNGHLDIRGQIYAYDLNEALIGMYINIRDKKSSLYDTLLSLVNEFSECTGSDVNRKPTTIDEAKSSKESYYYWIRHLYNNCNDKLSVKASAYFIFLNKTGFRGMYREGPNGLNIPYGNYKNPTIIDEESLSLVSELIQCVTFICCDFSKAFSKMKKRNNFIYLDPPYVPEDISSFVGYTKDGFGPEQHKKLFSLIDKKRKTNKIMMSNSDVQLVKDSFPHPANGRKYKCRVIECRRAINANKPGSKTNEVIITNYIHTSK